MTRRDSDESSAVCRRGPGRRVTSAIRVSAERRAAGDGATRNPAYPIQADIRVVRFKLPLAGCRSAVVPDRPSRPGFRWGSRGQRPQGAARAAAQWREAASPPPRACAARAAFSFKSRWQGWLSAGRGGRARRQRLRRPPRSCARSLGCDGGSAARCAPTRLWSACRLHEQRFATSRFTRGGVAGVAEAMPQAAFGGVGRALEEGKDTPHLC
jgi:hypothetical protein